MRKSLKRFIIFFIVLILCSLAFPYNRVHAIPELSPTTRLVEKFEAKVKYAENISNIIKCEEYSNYPNNKETAGKEIFVKVDTNTVFVNGENLKIESKNQAMEKIKEDSTIFVLLRNEMNVSSWVENINEPVAVVVFNANENINMRKSKIITVDKNDKTFLTGSFATKDSPYRIDKNKVFDKYGNIIDTNQIEFSQDSDSYYDWYEKEYVEISSSVNDKIQDAILILTSESNETIEKNENIKNQNIVEEKNENIINSNNTKEKTSSNDFALGVLVGGLVSLALITIILFATRNKKNNK